MIEEAIYHLAKAHAGLTAIIGTADTIRFNPEAEDDPGIAAPKVIYNAPTPNPVKGIYRNSSWSHTPVTFFAMATTAMAAKALLLQVRDCFERYHSAGAVVGATAHKIDDVEATGETSAYFDGELNLYVEEIELEFFHN